jgi:hypothetical protein
LRRTLSILLIVILFFNAIGFYGLLVGIQYHRQQALVELLDNESYDLDKTNLLKIPLTLPYATDQEEFQRVDGNFEYHGEYYRLVKQRLSRDTLYIVYLKDHDTKKVNTVLKDYVKSFTDQPAHSSKHQGKITISFGKEYYGSSFSISPQATGWIREISTHFIPGRTSSAFICSPSQPPEQSRLVIYV